MNIQFIANQWPTIDGNEFLLNLGEEWLYQINGEDAPKFGTDKAAKWSGCGRHTLADVLPWVDYWRGQNKEAYPAHLGTGRILWVDFDDRPNDQNDLPDGWALEAAQAAYDELLNAVAVETYTERSRTFGRYHAAYLLPDGHGLPLRQIKGMHGIDLLIGNGWVRMTGVSNGLPIKPIPQDLLERLRVQARQYNFDGVSVSTLRSDEALCSLPFEDAIAETRRRMAATGNRTREGFSYRQLLEGADESGEAPALTDENLSQSRAALIQWAGKITCGHPDQHEIVWQIVSNSHVAHVTPHVSKSNPRRFISPSKINYDRFNVRGEYHKLIGRANAEAEEAKAEAERQKSKTAELMKSRKNARLSDPGYWTRIDIGDFPVPTVREYRDYLVASAVKTNSWIVNGATLAHLGHILGNRVCGTTGVFPAIYVVVPAPSGRGKDSASYEPLKRVAPGYVFPIGNLGSGGGLHKALLEPGCDGCGLVVIDEYQDFLRGKGGNEHVRSSITTLKTLFGKMQRGKELPQMKLVGQTREAVPEPAVCLIGTGIEEDILAAFAETSLTDGHFPRHLFIDILSDLTNYRSKRPQLDPPTALVEKIRAVLENLPKPAQYPSAGGKAAPQGGFGRTIPTVIYFESEALEDDAFKWADEVDELREGKYCGTRFDEMLRAAAENAYRIATILGAYAPGQLITRDIWEWSKGFVVNSVSYLLRKDEEGALDSAVIALSQQIMHHVQQFFEGSGSKAESQQRMRDAGQFRLGSLPNWKRLEDKAGQINSKDPAGVIQSAIRLLKLSGKIEVLEDNRHFEKCVYGKGSAFDN